MLNWRKVIPNFLTVLATVVGLSAVRLAMIGEFQLSVLAILASGLLDGLDGPVARAIGGTSNFGAELDSLSDYVNFGVTPGLVLFFWSFSELGWIGWCVSLVYTICMACRLARFNAGVDFNASSITKNFFMGVPAPAGAMLVTSPLCLSFHYKTMYNQPDFTIPVTLFVSFLLVSRIPTFSSKMINGSNLAKLGSFKYPLILILFLIGVANLTIHPWLSVVIISVLYVISFPISFLLLVVLSKKNP